MQKLLKDLNKYLQAQDSSGPWEQSKVSAMDRALGEIGRIMDKKVGLEWETVLTLFKNTAEILVIKWGQHDKYDDKRRGKQKRKRH